MKGRKTDGTACAYKHGHDYRSPTYRSWKMMRVRCGWAGSKDALNYSKRGIFVCERWDDFRNFLEDMGERPPDMTLERRDNNGPYCKENCEWATRQTQNRNSRNCRPVTVDGKVMLFEAACKYLGISPSTVRRRMRSGMSFTKAIEKKG